MVCRLLQTLDGSLVQPTVLANFRLLWLDLSHLATQTGTVNCYTCGCYLVHQFFMVALSAYATLSDVISGNFDSSMLVVNCTLFSVFMIFAICEGAHNVTLKVSRSILVLIQALIPCCMSTPLPACVLN